MLSYLQLRKKTSSGNSNSVAFSHRILQWSHLVWTAYSLQLPSLLPKGGSNSDPAAAVLNFPVSSQKAVTDTSPTCLFQVSSVVSQLWWASSPAHFHQSGTPEWCPPVLHSPGAAFLRVHFENSIVCQGQLWLLSCSSLLVTFGCYLEWDHTQNLSTCIQPAAYHIKATLNFTVAVMENRKTSGCMEEGKGEKHHIIGKRNSFKVSSHETVSQLELQWKHFIKSTWKQQKQNSWEADGTNSTHDFEWWSKSLIGKSLGICHVKSINKN